MVSRVSSAVTLETDHCPRLSDNDRLWRVARAARSSRRHQQIKTNRHGSTLLRETPPFWIPHSPVTQSKIRFMIGHLSLTSSDNPWQTIMCLFCQNRQNVWPLRSKLAVHTTTEYTHTDGINWPWSRYDIARRFIIKSAWFHHCHNVHKYLLFI